MVNIGAYAPGSNAEIDQALKMITPIQTYLQQSVDECSTLDQSFNALLKLTGRNNPSSVKPRV